jgi:GDPmannose 4,6-dehydratase
MFNHESPRRGEEFVTRKVTSTVARIAQGRPERLRLGNVDPQRDWGWAPDYVAALPLIAAADEADDFVLATGVTHSVRKLCQVAFGLVDLDYRDYLDIDPGLFRPADVDLLRGDASKARQQLGWAPQVGFEEIVGMLLEHDLTVVAA